MRISLVLFFLTFFTISIFAKKNAIQDSTFIRNLLPVPQSVTLKSDIFIWTDDLTITHSPGTDDLISNFTHLTGLRFKRSQDKNSTGYFIVISSKVRVPEAEDLTQSKDDEAYSLNIDRNKIRITANTQKGLLWGLMTLAQLAQKDRDGKASVPGLAITDWPDYPYRGYMLDTGRAPYSASQIKRVIRICSAFKLNFLIIREGDDELNAFRFNRLPIGSDNPYALTFDDLSDLVSYGKRYGLTVIPEIESLGHIESKKRFYPELIQGGIQQDYWPGFYHIRKANLDINNPETYKLLHAMYDEIFPVFNVPMVHLGLDEVRLKKEQQAEHFARIIPVALDVAAKHNMDPDLLVWSDAPPTPQEYKENVVRCLWKYGNGISKDTEELNNQGLKGLLQPGCRERVFMAGGSGTNHKPYSKNSFKGALTNLYSWAVLGKEHPNFTGIFAVQWASNTIDGWIPDFLMAADMGWKIPDAEPDYAGYMLKLGNRLKKINDYAYPYPYEVPRPAWDGIWLNGIYWGEDIMTGEKAAPVVSIEPAGGYLSGKEQEIKISSSLPEATIFYTTDGSIPDRNANIYFEPFTISTTTNIKAIAFVPGRARSYIKEALFIDSSYQEPPVISKKLSPGLKYRYYENAVTKAWKLEEFLPVKEGTTPNVHIPELANGVEKFGLIFDGFLSVPADGRYTFHLLSNDGSRLFINDRPVINNDGRHAAKEKQVTLKLKKGIYPLTLKYFQYGGGKALKLFWEGQGLSKQEINENNFFH